MKFGQRIQEFIYSMSTDDKYSEFNSLQSFNRINKPESEEMLLNEYNNNGSVQTNDMHMSDEYYNALDGVHEVKLAWRHIKNWLVKYLPDLGSSLQDKCTSSDLTDFQKDLNIKLPSCVVEFFKLTDGQSNFGTNSDSVNGLIFGLLLMPLDEIVIETENWRKIAKVLATEATTARQNRVADGLAKLPMAHNSTQIKKKLTTTTESLILHSAAGSSTDNLSLIPLLSIPTQKSVPPGAIQETFAHPMWIPLITDEVGNYIGIDLLPPIHNKDAPFDTAGKYGQVILFGREFDTKYKIADSFGDFLLMFANDLEQGNWEIIKNKKNNDGDLFLGDEANLVYVDKESQLEMPYMEVLKKLSIDKWLASVKKQSEKNPIPDYIKALIASVTKKDNFILNYKSKHPIDKSIMNNIASLDTFNAHPENLDDTSSFKMDFKINEQPSLETDGTWSDDFVSSRLSNTTANTDAAEEGLVDKLEDVNIS